MKFELVELYSNKTLLKYCKKYVGAELCEDLRTEIIIKLSSISNIDTIIQGGYLLPYSIKMAYNFTTNKSTKFCKLYMFETNEVEDKPIFDIENNHTIEQKYLDYVYQCKQDQSNKYFYHANLLISLSHLKSVKELSKKTQIPYKSILHAINEYKTHLKSLLPITS